MTYIKSLLVSIIGAYEPVFYEQTIDSEIVQIIPDGFSGVDWSFILSGLFLIICFYCCMRLLGIILSWSVEKGGKL